MKTKTINIYEFSELSETAKEKALQNLSDINVDFDWWESVYSDAEESAGLRLTGFDIERGDCTGELLCGMMESIKLIKANHGESCDTYNLAIEYENKYSKLFAKYEEPERKSICIAEGNEYDFANELDELETEYKDELCTEYLSILRHEYEYQTTEEAIVETIEANEYEFNINGEQI